MAHSRSRWPSRSFAIHLSAESNSINKYPAKSHARRVAEKLDVTKGLLVLAATPSAIYPNSDQPVPFRQDRYFYYLSGCNEPGCCITYDISEDRLVLWLPEIDRTRVIWSGRGSTVEEALEKYDVDEAKYISSPSLVRLCGTDSIDDQGGLILSGTNLQDYVDDTSLYGDVDENVHTLVDSIPDQALRTMLLDGKGREVKLRYALDACRVIKDEHEIGLIRKANEITAEAHKAVLHTLHRLTNEAEVEAEYMRVCIARRAKEQAYSPIAGSGPNASVLHYVKNDGDFGDRQMMVLDAGCEMSCYASDVTRTLELNKRNPGTWPSKEAENVYELVERVQEACIAEMRPGKSFIEITNLAFDMTLDGLLELGVLKGEREEIRKAGTHFGFFPHGLGHHLGLEVHDVSPRPPPNAKSDSLIRYKHIKAPDGILWLSFPFQHPGYMLEYPIRTDITETGLCGYGDEFIATNVIDEVVPGTRECDLSVEHMTALALAKLNPVLRGKKDVLRRAVECDLHLADQGDDDAELCGVRDGVMAELPPLPPTFDFASSSLCRTAANTTNIGPDYSKLQPGMVVTIEPGIYFNAYLLDNFFVNNPRHSRFIDEKVLARYMPVGGVRIEDDILVTQSGYENLTTAPKGQEMLECIRRGAAGAKRR